MALPIDFNNAQFTEYFSTFLNNSGSIPSVLDSMPEDDNGLSFAERFTHRNYYKEIGSETEELFNMHLQIKCEEVVNRYKWKIEQYQSIRDKLVLQYVEVNNLQTDTYGGTDTLTRNDTDGGSESKTKSATKTGTHGLTRADKETGTEDNDITNTEYYNPVNVSSDNVVGKNTNEKDLAYGRSFSRSDNETNSDTENGTDETTFGKTFDRTDKTQYGKTLTREYTRQIPVVFKDVPSIMKATFDLQVLYEEALKYLDCLFMVVL